MKRSCNEEGSREEKLVVEVCKATIIKLQVAQVDLRGMRSGGYALVWAGGPRSQKSFMLVSSQPIVLLT